MNKRRKKQTKNQNRNTQMPTLRERLAAMTPEERDEAMRETAQHLRDLERRGLYEGPDYAETLAISDKED